MKTAFSIFLACVALFFIWLICLVLGHGCSYVAETADVVHQEVAPDVLLKKYSWFKDASAHLDEMDANIQVFDARVKSVKETYGADASKWPRDVREQLALNSAELAGVKAAYNGLAADYNAAMAKIQWRFCNVGQLPSGADKVLPREYRSYSTN